MQVGRCCRGLIELNLRGCSITDVGVQRIADGLGGADTVLGKLNLGDCRRITDVGVASLGASCHQLTDLNLGRCHKITNFGLGEIASGCQAIVHLDIHGCKGITDDALKRLASNCPGIRSLRIWGCDKLTAAGTGAFPQGVIPII